MNNSSQKLSVLIYLATQHRVHILGWKTSGKTKQSTLEHGGENVDEDDSYKSDDQELMLPCVWVHSYQHQGRGEEDHHEAQGPQQPRKELD